MDEGRTSSFEVTVQGAATEAKGEGATLLWSKLAKGRSVHLPSQPACSCNSLMVSSPSSAASLIICLVACMCGVSFPDAKTIIALYRQAAGLASA